MIVHVNIAPKNYGCVMILFDNYSAMATSFLGTNLSKMLGEYFLVFVWTTGQLAHANVNVLLEPETPPGHC